MKRLIARPRVLLCFLALIVFAVLWSVWYWGYRYTLVWLEGYSYFSTLPDFVSVLSHFPDDLLKYMGAFFLQFFAHPAWGAAIQAGFAAWVVVVSGTIVIRLFRNSGGLLWLSLLPLPFFIFYQYWDLTLERSMVWCLTMGGVLLLVYAFSCWKRMEWQVPDWLRHPVVLLVVFIVSLSSSLYFLLAFDERTRNHERIACVEYWGERQDWNKILELVPPQVARQNNLMRRYALLALSETGRLSEQVFRYGISQSGDFLFADRDEPFCCNFNALFYQSIALPNEVIHQTYQQGLQSSFGFGFAALRRLADTYIELKDYTMAKKYVDILSHSFGRGDWVKERMPELAEMKEAVPAYTMKGEPFTVASVLETVSSVYDRYPNNRKYADLLLCGILADRNGNSFYQVFQIVARHLYAHGERIPHYYEEALLVISASEKDIPVKYRISEETQKRFRDFISLMEAGKLKLAKKKYPDTYWSYIF